MRQLVLCFLLIAIVSAGTIPPWMNVKDTPAQRAKELLARMNLDEKLGLVHGYGGPYVGNVNANDRLKIPALHLEDGPQGVADGVNLVTAWPSALTVVATWDGDLVNQYGAAMGREQRLKGTNVMLGPMINIARVPFGGRNFESYGEDPFLAAALVKYSVTGIQSQGVIGCAKHFVDNNQEYHRTSVSANIDERTQYEIYFPAFKAAVDAGVGSIMCSYNRVNDVYACENNETLNVGLKQRMGFQGWVMSDWGATHSSAKAANAGLDQQMPDASFFGAPLTQAVNNGQVSKARVDDMALRILTPMFAVGLFDNPQTGNLSVDVRSTEHTLLARKLATVSTVLLKNDNNLLPITSSVTKIAVLGDDGHDHPTATGGGSGHVNAPYIVTPLDGIKNRAGSRATVSYANSADANKAAQLAKEADIAIVFVATSSSEGSDRSTLGLGTTQDNLVKAVAAAQPNTVVVIHHPGAVTMPWLSSVRSVLAAWLPGQEDGNAIAAVLFGDSNPSAKLPLSFPTSDDTTPVSTQAQYPGINDEGSYSEKLLVGYRWYDAKNEEPLFPFGHGLSYTTFDYSNFKVTGSLSSGATVTFDLKNSGKVAGAEVAQLYLGFPSSAGEPPKQLKGFSKVSLNPGQTQTVSIPLTSAEGSIWDATNHRWQLASGTFDIYVGSSSRDIRLKGTVSS
eukprot:TRINITY_DN205_c0_g1_i1.p1 TRINITY_DN205_c0_g1~~TRINITY_DN205_c0_g1_i1.p1  ORF type:complete len:679 (-),score=206.24 TRINITY_DN205_c0_g1_i1:112-2148(-)